VRHLLKVSYANQQFNLQESVGTLYLLVAIIRVSTNSYGLTDL